MEADMAIMQSQLADAHKMKSDVQRMIDLGMIKVDDAGIIQASQ